jgi:hypothetical protein
MNAPQKVPRYRMANIIEGSYLDGLGDLEMAIEVLSEFHVWASASKVQRLMGNLECLPMEIREELSALVRRAAEYQADKRYG